MEDYTLALALPPCNCGLYLVPTDTETALGLFGAATVIAYAGARVILEKLFLHSCMAVFLSQHYMQSTWVIGRIPGLTSSFTLRDP